jgi:glycerol-3-phosphate acyltransferase PlsY
MQILLDLGLVLLGYVLGSIPFGLIIVKLRTGKDIRQVESGRTGGTNAMRAAGFFAGLMTAIMDILKGAAAVWLARALGGSDFAQVLAPLGAILGHNYSIFLTERDAQGRLRFRGGAGGAPCLGGALGLWPPAAAIILLVGVVVFFGSGYASLTTISVGLVALIIFSVLAGLGMAPWQYVAYGLVGLLLLLWALRPNIRRLLSGQERVVSISLHGRLRARQEQRAAVEAFKDVE